MAKTTEVKETPLMQQYNKVKQKYPGALLLFRVGDFYETFGQDAIIASSILGIVLTKRANGSASHVELAGFPHHSLDNYLPKLVRAGQRVAICDQLEDPKLTKTIVKRGVTELITPGIAYNENIIQQKSNNYLAAIFCEDTRTDFFGIAFLDISTGEFLTAEGNWEYMDKLLVSYSPSEILMRKSSKKIFNSLLNDQQYTYQLDDWIYGRDYALEILLNHFETISFKGFGIENLPLAIIAAGAVLHYVKDAQHHNLAHITNITRIEEDRFMWLDRFTIRNLELVGSLNDSGSTLLSVLDQTLTPMGARLLYKWMLMPLKQRIPIEQRQQVVTHFIKNPALSHSLKSTIKSVGDLERLISKVALKKISPRELRQLQVSLSAIVELIKETEKEDEPELLRLKSQLMPCHELIEKLLTTLIPEPPVSILKGNAIATGINHELDELRKIAFAGKDYLIELQQREIINTGISSLKVSYNGVFGYYLEVTHLHREKVPTEWIRKQTLVNAERYITPELKEYEEKIIGAEEKIFQLEQEIYRTLVDFVGQFIQPIQTNADIIAQLDVLLNFSQLAISNKYCKPMLDDSFSLTIENGRHPVIEKKLKQGEPYISNNLFLDPETQQLIILTGPNMSGKSAFLRQVGLIVLMAHIGSYVPASAAKMGIVDKIFTRVGASDNLSSGESTFMVEMNETATILNNISARSLLILDEIGRGTSTYDGISIAWAIAEYLHNHKTARAKTLFATHYHELNEMTEVMPGIKNYNVSVKEIDDKIIFLRKLVEGGSNHSFGIHVAKIAGIPKEVIQRADQLLLQLESNRNLDGKDATIPIRKAKPAGKNDFQLSIFQLDDPVLTRLRDNLNGLDVNSLTPIEALMKLDEIQNMLKG